MATLHAYITKYSESRGQDLHAMDPDALAGALVFSRSPDHHGDGWLKVGTATVEVHLAPRAEVVSNAVAALRAEQQQRRAAAHAEDMRIEQQINSLLCIEGSVTEAA